MSKFIFRVRVALRSGLWIVPTLMVVVAVGIAMGLLSLDARVDDQIAERWPWLVGLSAEGARSILTAVAGSMITVAGVVFSITVVVLSLAASQYTSRVLRNFMSDRATQVVLGVFVGVFGYCLVVLSQVQGSNGDSYVPILAVLGGVALALVAIAFLIFFIHHIATSIQISEILARAANEALQAIDEIFPENVGETADDEDDVAEQAALPSGSWHAVPALDSGYIQTVEAHDLLKFATQHDTVVRMECGIGQFAIAGAPLLSLPSDVEIDHAVIAKLNSYFAIDTQRTIEQDPAFGLRQITDIALRALSPGINDTTTAVMCLDYATAIMARLACRRVPSHCRLVDGKLRLIARGPDFADMVAEAFTQIRHNSEGNVAVLMALFHALHTLECLTRWPSRRRILLQHANATLEVAQRTIVTNQERQDLEAQGRRVIARLSAREPQHDTSNRVSHSFVGSTIRDHAEART